MKLKETYITQQIGDEQVMVAVGEDAKKFMGIVRSNASAAYIIDCLRSERTEKQLAEMFLSEYDCTDEQAENSVIKVLAALRETGALVE